jgi:large subunit ribosomal protein L35
MPKLKTKSGVKKRRFWLTGIGKVIATQANKRHGLIKRTNKQIRRLRGTTILSRDASGQEMDAVPLMQKIYVARLTK